jgi:hypothetical protein
MEFGIEWLEESRNSLKEVLGEGLFELAKKNDGELIDEGYDLYCMLGEYKNAFRYLINEYIYKKNQEKSIYAYHIFYVWVN